MMKSKESDSDQLNSCLEERADEVEASNLLEDIDGDNFPLPESAEPPSRHLQSIRMWALKGAHNSFKVF